MATSFAFQPIVTDGLIFNVDPLNSKSYNGVSNIVTDIVNGSTLTMVGSPTFSGRTFDFNSSALTKSVINTGQNFSGFAWIKSDTISERNTIMATSYNYAGGRNGWLFATSHGYVGLTYSFFISIGTDVVARTTINNSFQKNIWTQIGFTVTNGGSDIKLYVNGVESSYQYTNLSSGTITYTTNEFNIGRRLSTGQSDYFKGNIGTTLIYNRVLSSAEILQNYNATKWRFDEHPIVEDGLVFYVDPKNTSSYPGTGTSVTSLKGGYTGTLNNGVAFDNISFGFDGTNDNISTNFYPTITQGSISVWVKLNVTSYSAFINDDGYGAFALGIDPSNPGYFAMGVYDGVAKWAYDPTPFSTNKWYQVTGTYKNGETVKIYVDGVYKGQSSTVGTINTAGTTPIKIGKWAAAHTNGNISQVMYYNRVLTPTEVLQNYNATKNRFL